MNGPRPPPPPPPGGAPPLPSGWQELRDSQGRVYFFNTRNGQTTWYRPAAPPPTPPSQAPRPGGSFSALAAGSTSQGSYQAKEDYGKGVIRGETHPPIEYNGTAPGYATPHHYVNPAPTGYPQPPSPPPAQAPLPEDDVTSEPVDNQSSIYSEASAPSPLTPPHPSSHGSHHPTFHHPTSHHLPPNQPASHQPSSHPPPSHTPPSHPPPSHQPPSHQPPSHRLPSHQPASHQIPSHQPPPRHTSSLYSQSSQHYPSPYLPPPPPYDQQTASHYQPPVSHHPSASYHPPPPPPPPHHVASSAHPPPSYNYHEHAPSQHGAHGVPYQGPPSLRPGEHATSYSSQYSLHQNASMYSQPSMGYSGAPYASTSFIGSNGVHDASGSGAEVQLEFSAEKLKKKDIIGKSDPQLVVFMLALNRAGEKRWKEVGRTEKIMNDHNPRWSKRVTVSFRFYEMQKIRLAVFDVDPGNSLVFNDELGLVETDLGRIVSAGLFKTSLKKMRYARGVPRPIEGMKSQGELTVRVHNASLEGQTKVSLQLSAKGLDRKDGPLGKSDPYFIVKQVMRDNEYSTLYKSKKIMKTLNPSWGPVHFVVNTQGRPRHDVKLCIDCIDWDRYSTHDLIGRSMITMAHLSSGESFPIINEAKKRRKGRRYTDSGKFIVNDCRLVDFPHFNSYLQAGLKIHLTVGIDFTASNGDPSNPTSLHYMSNTQRPNQYMQALESVGGILNQYTPDGYIAAYGFGAKLQPNTSASFDFPLNPNGDPYCCGVDGLIHAYKQRAASVQFAGPTNFAPLIRTAKAIASQTPLSHNNIRYHCLLILTDGAISDTRESIDAIIDCSYSVPLSIIIIGVGTANFTAMKILDADDRALQSVDGQKKAKRDIVQFVEFRKYEGNPYAGGLSADVLAELPSRIVETMVDENILPHTNVVY